MSADARRKTDSEVDADESAAHGSAGEPGTDKSSQPCAGCTSAEACGGGGGENPALHARHSHGGAPRLVGRRDSCVQADRDRARASGSGQSNAAVVPGAAGVQLRRVHAGEVCLVTECHAPGAALQTPPALYNRTPTPFRLVLRWADEAIMEIQTTESAEHPPEWSKVSLP